MDLESMMLYLWYQVVVKLQWVLCMNVIILCSVLIGVYISLKELFTTKNTSIQDVYTK